MEHAGNRGNDPGRLLAARWRSATVAARHCLRNVMELSKEFVKAKSPCAAGFRWFIRHQHEGRDYQLLLDNLVRDGRVEDACWLLSQFGPTDAELHLEHLEAEALIFAGTVIVHGDVRVAGVLRVGRNLRVGAGIRAARIEAGEDIHSGGAIFCAGALHAGGTVKAAWSIETGGDLHCEKLRVGWGLECQGNLALTGEGQVGQELLVAGDIRCAKSLRSGGALTGRGNIHAAHGIDVGGDVQCGKHLQADWGIRARGSILAEGAIKAGETLQAEDEICAGPGYGVYAGLSVQMEAWEDCAGVRAARKPEGLVSGYWQAPGAGLALG